MTETDKDDKLIENFFAENRKEIADKGFSRRVMQQLPDRSELREQIINWLLTVVSLALFVHWGGIEATWRVIYQTISHLREYDFSHLDPVALAFAGGVLLFMIGRKIVSLA